jgi:hypothetical protein
MVEVGEAVTTLYCILAREADTAVIFRRGPSKRVRLISWDLKNNRFNPGQWLFGRINERKADITPDGRKLVYLAANYKRSKDVSNWVAVSSPPYLKAQVLWETLGTWPHISLFDDNNTLSLAVYSDDRSLEPYAGFKIPRQLKVRKSIWPGHFFAREDHPRLVRDGWDIDNDPVYMAKPKRSLISYRKSLSRVAAGLCLEMTVGTKGEVEYSFKSYEETLLKLDAEWADARGAKVYYSNKGSLFQLKLGNQKQRFSEPICLADFSDMKFENIVAPYHQNSW